LDEASLASFYAEEFRSIELHEYYKSATERLQAIHMKEYKAADSIHRFIGDLCNTTLWIADIGCGTGGMVRFFSEIGYRVAGCDRDNEAVNYGRCRDWIYIQVLQKCLRVTDPSMW